MSLWSKAWNQVPLSPSERAFLRFVAGILWTALIAGATAGIQYLATNGSFSTVNWVILWSTASGAFTHTLFMTIQKFFTSQGDIPPPTTVVPVPPITQPVPITPTVPNSALMTNIRPLGPSHTITSQVQPRGLLSSFSGALTQRKPRYTPPGWMI